MDQDSILFSFVMYGEIPALETKHPLVFLKFGKQRFSYLNDSPDISDNFPVLFYLQNSSQLLSWTFIFPDKIHWGKNEKKWAWTGSTFTEPQFRGLGLATILMKKCTNVLLENGIGRGATYSADATVHIYRKLGFVVPGYFDRRLLVRNIEPILKSHFKSQIINRFGKHIFNWFVRPLFRALHEINILMKKSISYEEIEPEKLNSLQELCYSSNFYFNNSPIKLIWKLKNTKLKHNIYLVKRNNGIPIGYFIIRNRFVSELFAGRYKNFSLFTVVDYGLYNDNFNSYSIILDAALSVFWKTNSDVFEIVSSTSELNRVARTRMVIKVGKGISFAFCVPEHWKFNKESHDISNWHLTGFCSDAYSFGQ